MAFENIDWCCSFEILPAKLLSQQVVAHLPDDRWSAGTVHIDPIPVAIMGDDPGAAWHFIGGRSAGLWGRLLPRRYTRQPDAALTRRGEMSFGYFQSCVRVDPLAGSTPSFILSFSWLPVFIPLVPAFILLPVGAALCVTI